MSAGFTLRLSFEAPTYEQARVVVDEEVSRAGPGRDWHATFEAVGHVFPLNFLPPGTRFHTYLWNVTVYVHRLEPLPPRPRPSEPPYVPPSRLRLWWCRLLGLPPT